MQRLGVDVPPVPVIARAADARRRVRAPAGEAEEEEGQPQRGLAGGGAALAGVFGRAHTYYSSQ